MNHDPRGARRRILHIGPAPKVPQGGIAAYVLGLLGSPLRSQYTFSIVDVSVPEVCRRHRAARAALGALFAGRTALAVARERPDLVHVHTSDWMGFWEKGVLGAIAGARASPVVFHLHGGSFDQFLGGLNGLARATARRILHRAARVVVLSEAWRPLVAEFAPADRIVVLPNAIATADFARTTAPQPHSGPLRLLFLGLLTPRKGLDDLFAALVGLGFTEWRLDIVGGEEIVGERRRLEAVASTLGLGSRVHFQGPRDGDEKRAFLHAADLFVLPSRSESFGIANLEAMAAGLPIVSTRTGAIPEYLTHEVNALLVQPGDGRALGDAIGRLAADAALRRKLGDAARDAVRAYDWTHVATRVAQLYEEVLAEVSAGRR